MFAVIRTGGKQYRVAEQDRIVVERLAVEPGAIVALSDVLMIAPDGEAPTFEKDALGRAAVFAEVLEQTRGEKIIVFKKIRRQNHRRKRGHRQDLTVLRIAAISPTGERPADLEARAAEAKAGAAAKNEARKAKEATDASSAEPKKAAAKPKAARAKAAAKPKAKAKPKTKAKKEE